MNPFCKTFLCTALLSVPVASAAQTCSMSTAPVVFGAYNPLVAGDTDSTGTISVTCNALVQVLVTYSIKLDGGQGGSIAARRMNAGGSQLFYQLYDSTLRTTVWGDGSGGSGFRSDSYLLGLASVTRAHTVYGRIAGRQNVGPGSFTDAVTVLLTY